MVGGMSLVSCYVRVCVVDSMCIRFWSCASSQTYSYSRPIREPAFTRALRCLPLSETRSLVMYTPLVSQVTGATYPYIKTKSLVVSTANKTKSLMLPTSNLKPCRGWGGASGGRGGHAVAAMSRIVCHLSEWKPLSMALSYDDFRHAVQCIATVTSIAATAINATGRIKIG